MSMFYLPNRSAIQEPAKDPIAPPTSKIETIDDQRMSRFPLLKYQS